jgi:hypothetical protein
MNAKETTKKMNAKKMNAKETTKKMNAKKMNAKKMNAKETTKKMNAKETTKKVKATKNLKRCETYYCNVCCRYYASLTNLRRHKSSLKHKELEGKRDNKKGECKQNLKSEKKFHCEGCRPKVVLTDVIKGKHEEKKQTNQQNEKMEMEGDWIILSQVGVVDCVNLDWQVQEENTEEQKQDYVSEELGALLEEFFSPGNNEFEDDFGNVNIDDLTQWVNNFDVTGLDLFSTDYTLPLPPSLLNL